MRYRNLPEINNLIMWKNYRPPSLSELTPMLSNTGLTHLDSEASNYRPVRQNDVTAKYIDAILV